MVRVARTELNSESNLLSRIRADDFIDCFTVAARMSPREAACVITDFPRWARWLLLVRGVVTAPFGLSQDGPPAEDKIGPFPVERETARELVAGFNDRHLDFRVSVWSDNAKVSLATWVRPHNAGGRIYLLLILPFHILIARDALKRVATVSAGHAR